MPAYTHTSWTLPGTYERIAKGLLKGQPKPKTMCWVVGGCLVRGSASLHRTPQSRRWRLFWRLKDNRQK
jgi:hypothetical protein